MRPPELIHYKEYIKSEYWTERKRQYFSLHPRKCEVCGHPDVELHHLKYGEYGREADKHLAALCRVHHDEVHAAMQLRRNMSYQTRYVVEDLKEKWEKMRTAPAKLAKIPEQHSSQTISDGIDFLARPIWTIINKFLK